MGRAPAKRARPTHQESAAFPGAVTNGEACFDVEVMAEALSAWDRGGSH